MLWKLDSVNAEVVDANERNWAANLGSAFLCLFDPSWLVSPFCLFPGNVEWRTFVIYPSQRERKCAACRRCDATNCAE